MGGFGSGRPAQHVTCESSLKLDLASPATRTALKPNAWTTGSWHWSSHGREIASIGYVWSGRDAELTLRYNRDGETIEQSIDLVATAPEFGGQRWWFVCPFSGARVRALFLPPGGKLWGSRRAYKLRYQSQRESGQGRALLRMLTRNGPGPAILCWPPRSMMRAIRSGLKKSGARSGAKKRSSGATKCAGSQGGRGGGRRRAPNTGGVRMMLHNNGKSARGR